MNAAVIPLGCGLVKGLLSLEEGNLDTEGGRCEDMKGGQVVTEAATGAVQPQTTQR